MDADQDKLIVTPTKTSHFDETTRRDPDANYVTKASKAGKIITVKTKRNVLSKPANENDGGSSKTSTKERVLSESEPELSDRLEDVIENQLEIAYNANDHRNVTDNNRNEASSTGDNHQNGNDNRSETSSNYPMMRRIRSPMMRRIRRLTMCRTIVLNMC